MAILMRTSRAACVAATVLALAACELTPSPTAITLTEERVMVQSVLLAGDTAARALIRLIPAMSDPFNPFAQPEWIPIAGATVRLVTGADTIAMTPRLSAPANPCLTGPLHENSPAADLLAGCYVGSVPGRIVSGGSYELIIDMPGRGRVQGRTVVPAALAIAAPEAGAQIAAATTFPGPGPGFTVTWAEAPPHRHVELDVAARAEQCTAHIAEGGGFFGVGGRVVSGQTSAEVGVQLQCTAPIETDVPGDIVLTAFDSTYSRYTRAIRDHHRMADAVAGFSGPAIGVFGSGASARQPVRFVPN
jgi:hypothetical protein